MNWGIAKLPKMSKWNYPGDLKTKYLGQTKNTSVHLKKNFKNYKKCFDYKFDSFIDMA